MKWHDEIVPVAGGVIFSVNRLQVDAPKTTNVYFLTERLLHLKWWPRILHLHMCMSLRQLAASHAFMYVEI